MGSFSRLCLANYENILLITVNLPVFQFFIIIEKVSLGVKIMIVIVTLVIEKTTMIGTLL